MTDKSLIDLLVSPCQEKIYGQSISRHFQAMRPDVRKQTNTSKALSRSQNRRRDDIVQAALKVFDRDGYEAAKMVDIAAEADVAKGTLYLYFDNKAALLEGVIQSTILPAIEKIGSDAKTNSGSARELLTQQLQIIAARQASPEMKILLRLMISAPEQHRPIIDFFHTHVLREAMELLHSTLQRGVASGEFRAEAAHIDPLVLIGAHIYVPVWHNLFGDTVPLDIKKLSNDGLNLIMDGLLSSPE